ncbi:MAG: hypothetical protein DRJ52_10180 [Thermoprotei archaeon]|nr:MAG: hypothetical protein DRJ52_10180 [Thermoprotei archaeon]RLF00808.1 MAG: hypothetical protein DRJ63_01485 [Thermoprotei archaeon]
MLTKIAVATIVYAISFIVVYSVLTKCPLLPGIDGPYYLVQTNYLLKHLSLKYMDPPLAFIILAVFRAAIPDPFLSLKIGMSFITACITVVLFLYADYFLKDEVSSALIALVFLFNSTTFRLLQDFWKNITGFLWIVLSLYFTAKSIKEGGRSNGILASVFIVLTFLTHILDAGITTVTYFTMLILMLLFAKKHVKKIAVQEICLVSLLAASFALPIIVGGDIAKGIAFIKSLLKVSEELEKPLSIVAVRWSIIGILGGIASILYSLYAIRNNPTYSLLGAIGVALVFFNIPFIERAWLWRFQLMNGILLALALSLLLQAVKEKTARIALLLIIVGFMIFESAHYLERGLRPSIPIAEYYEIKALVNKIPEGSLLVVPNPKLRYWVETLYEKTDERVSRDYQSLQILVVEKRPVFRKPPWPLFFKGKFIEAYVIPPRR